MYLDYVQTKHWYYFQVLMNKPSNNQRQIYRVTCLLVIVLGNGLIYRPKLLENQYIAIYSHIFVKQLMIGKSHWGWVLLIHQK